MSTQTETKHYPVTHTEAEWKKLLTPEQFHIMREHGTERAGSCALNYEKRAGTFYCAGCNQALFASKKKFESGTGWPSFNDPEPGSIDTTTDRSWGMERSEVNCRLQPGAVRLEEEVRERHRLAELQRSGAGLDRYHH